MSKVFFKDLELPEPAIYLGVGSGTHAEQTGKVMIEFEKVLFKEKPDLVMVVGDVNSTVACALAASKIDYSKELGANIKVDAVKGEQRSANNLTNSINAMNARGTRPLIAYVEAGLRSFDRAMPEEINRLLTDQISDFLFTPSPDANENLKKEGIPEEKIFLVGNVMVDSLSYNLEREIRFLTDLGFFANSNFKLGRVPLEKNCIRCLEVVQTWGAEAYAHKA